MKKVCFFFFVLFVCNGLRAQSFNIENLGFRAEAAINFYDVHRINFFSPRATLTYDFKKLQFTGGIVISKIIDADKQHWTFEEYMGITGAAMGLKRYIHKSGKGGSYYFIETMLLNYHCHESLYKTMNYQTKKEEFSLYPDIYTGNRTFIIQPVIGSGAEGRFLKYITFSIDAGFGIMHRKIEYEYPSSTNLRTLNSFIMQIRFNLGFDLHR